MQPCLVFALDVPLKVIFSRSGNNEGFRCPWLFFVVDVNIPDRNLRCSGIIRARVIQSFCQARLAIVNKSI
jgi:hypothetical protein